MSMAFTTAHQNDEVFVREKLIDFEGHRRSIHRMGTPEKRVVVGSGERFLRRARCKQSPLRVLVESTPARRRASAILSARLIIEMTREDHRANRPMTTACAIATFAGAAAFLASASTSAACAVCDSELGQQVRAGVFNVDFAPTTMAVLAPFPLFLLAVALVRLALPRLMAPSVRPPAYVVRACHEN
jgi:hypothetical protein